MPRRHKPEKTEGKTTPLIFVSVIAAILVVGGLVLLDRNTSAKSAALASSARDWGNPNAPVTIEEYSDFQ